MSCLAFVFLAFPGDLEPTNIWEVMDVSLPNSSARLFEDLCYLKRQAWIYWIYCPFDILAKGTVGGHPIVAGNIWESGRFLL